MMDLTEREKQVLDFIENAIKNDGYAPSVRDICAALCIKSTSTVHMYMQRLDQKGYIKKDQNKSRAISIDHARISPDEKMLRVPLLGKVRAGTPITAVQNYDGYVDFPSSMAHKKNNLFALRIIGESMREAGIMDGDIVVVEGCKYAENGEIVVAMIDDESTVKRFYNENGKIRLQPENNSMHPIFPRNCIILGKVIANFRFY